jgi:hypothetical protein
VVEPPGHRLPAPLSLTDLRLRDVSTTPTEVKKILSTLEVGKAHGVDGISARLLKETCESINAPLCLLMNESFSTGKVPSSWKQANISPVHKKESRSTVGNYRPYPSYQ